MSTLRDFLASDMDTFLNTDELAESHDIDGKQVDCIIDGDIFKGRQSPLDGVYVSSIMLFVRLSDIGERPVVRQHLHLDGELYLVTNCNLVGGMLEITLEANEA